MKIDNTDIEIDFIGTQTSLTKEEEKVLSNYFKKKKESLKFSTKKKIVRKDKIKNVEQ